MVVDMLTSSQDQIPPRGAPMMEHGRGSPTALCADRHPEASGFHRSDDLGSSSSNSCSSTVRTTPSDCAKSSGRDSAGSHEDRDGSRRRQPEDKATRSCKRKLALPSSSLGSNDGSKAPDSEKKDLASPPPAKRWVIGPLLQSFKSKMASFTEIVMSPVRLFKPTELPAGSTNEALSVHPDNREDGKEDSHVICKNEEGITPGTQLPVQRLRFDTNSSDASDPEQGQDSIPKDDGSYGSLISTSTRRSTRLITGGVRASDVQQCSKEVNQNCESINLRPPDAPNSVWTSLKEGSGSCQVVRELIVLCERKSLDDFRKHMEQANESKSQEQDPNAKDLRLPTPAIGKRKKGRGWERLAENDGAVGADRVEESSTVTQTKPLELQAGKRRKVRVSDESLGTCGPGDAQISGLNSCDSSEKEKTGQERASRSRSKRAKEVKGRSGCLDTTSAPSDGAKSASTILLGANASTPAEAPPSSESMTWSGSRTTRRLQNDRAPKERKSGIVESSRGDPAERLRASNGTSDSKLVQRSNIRRGKHKSETPPTPADKKPQVSRKSSSGRRVKRPVDAFEDQGMSMSLTLKLGSGLDRETDAGSIMTCEITTKGRKMGEEVILSGASCVSGATPEEHFHVRDDVNGGNVDKKDKPRRWCVYLERRETQEEVEQEDDPKPGRTSSGRGSNRLKRSLSCPDIASLQHGDDAPVSDKTLHGHPSPLKKAAHLSENAPSPFKRARRHTVCSVEIEREIAPLCLRKEVYPKWGSTSSHQYPQSPGKSLASLVSCFLSSPLAFLSRKSNRGHADDSGYGAGSSNLGPVVSSSSPSPTLLKCPASSGAPGGSAFFADAPRTPEQSSMSSRCSVFDAVSMEAGEGVVQHGCEEPEQSRISAASEEKALSDSEIKPDNKQTERRKVSSIRIRKTLPKPQYNLTPMGLPKAVRIKKKVFSVEEIYTNKNFSKPPEGRLETIFEVPLSRRDGSQSLVGPKRVKRFVEFPELGVARKPKKPLVCGAGGGGAQRKAAASSGMGRTRRGREGEALHLQDLDSLLCSKLNELDVWMATEQVVY